MIDCFIGDKESFFTKMCWTLSALRAERTRPSQVPRGDLMLVQPTLPTTWPWLGLDVSVTWLPWQWRGSYQLSCKEFHSNVHILSVQQIFVKNKLINTYFHKWKSSQTQRKCGLYIPGAGLVTLSEFPWSWSVCEARVWIPSTFGVPVSWLVVRKAPAVGDRGRKGFPVGLRRSRVLCRGQILGSKVSGSANIFGPLPRKVWPNGKYQG